MKRVLIAVILLLLTTMPAYAAPAGRGAAMLGATQSDWQHQYGAPHRIAGLMLWNPCPKERSTYQDTVIFMDGRTFSIAARYCTDATPSESARIKLAAAFMPTDARYLGTHSYGGATNRVYFSARLASQAGFKPGMFLPASFAACGPGWNAVIPGTKYKVTGMTQRGIFSLNLDADGSGSWSLEIGTCA